MSEDCPENQIVPAKHGALALTHIADNNILSEMVETALRLARPSECPVPLRFRVGEQELGETAYRQLRVWAGALTLEPEEILRRLSEKTDAHNASRGFLNNALPTTFEDGNFRSIMWNIDTLPIAAFSWEGDLSLTALSFSYCDKSLPSPQERLLRAIFASPTPQKTPKLTHLPELFYSLTSLFCAALGLETLDVSNLTKLELLDCCRNSMHNLRLSGALTRLDAGENALTSLEVSQSPALVELWCDSNRLTELNLTALTKLEELSCSSNQLTELDLSSGFSLQLLYIRSNKLSTLDLSNVPHLRELSCGNNLLERLDLHSSTLLEVLDCSHNRLRQLELSHTPRLKTLVCANNSLVVLDIRPLVELQELAYDRDKVRLIKRPDQPF